MLLSVELLLLAALAVSFLYGAKLRKPPSLTGLDRRTTDVLKGMAILVIMVHHMVLRMSHPGILLLFRGIGYLGVAVFFFCSGYGMTVSAEKKGIAYADGMFRKRLLMIYLPAVAVNAVYMVIRILCFGKTYSPAEWCSGLLLMVDVDSSMWYIITIMIWYLTFGIALRCCKTVRARLIVLFGVCICYMAVCLLARLSKNWVDTALMFPLGAAAASYRTQVFDRVNRCKTALWLPVFAVLCGGCMALSFGKEDYFSLVLRIVSAFFFMAMLLLLVRIVDLSGVKICAAIGTITLECYLIHGKVIRLVKLQFGDVGAKEILIYVIATALCTAGFCLIYRQYKKLLTAPKAAGQKGN